MTVLARTKGAAIPESNQRVLMNGELCSPPSLRGRACRRASSLRNARAGLASRFSEPTPCGVTCPSNFRVSSLGMPGSLNRLVLFRPLVYDPPLAKCGR